MYKQVVCWGQVSDWCTNRWFVGPSIHQLWSLVPDLPNFKFRSDSSELTGEGDWPVGVLSHRPRLAYYYVTSKKALKCCAVEEMLMLPCPI